MKHVTLQITHWGYAIGGEHYSVTIYTDEAKRIEVIHKMSAEYAIRLNKKDGCSYYRSGHKTGRFETEYHAIQKSIEVALCAYPELKYIFKNEYASAQPREIIWCIDKDVMNQLNDLWREIDKFYDDDLDPWKLHEKEMNRICDAYLELKEKCCE